MLAAICGAIIAARLCSAALFTPLHGSAPERVRRAGTVRRYRQLVASAGSGKLLGKLLRNVWWSADDRGEVHAARGAAEEPAGGVAEKAGFGDPREPAG